MIKEFVYYSKKIGWRRRVNVYFPSTYNNKDKFPVIYAFDGANLHDPKNSLSGHSWEVKKTMERLIKAHVTKGFIVVGIYTSRNRLLEYTPVKYNEESGIKGEPLGDTTLDFFDEVMTYIDNHYLTNGVNHIVGSSCGGIMSLYAIAKYPKKYLTAGVFSIASTILTPNYSKMIEASPFDPNNKVFIYMGDKESDKEESKMLVDDAYYYNEMLKKKGIKTENLIGKNKEHTETSWASALDDYIRFIEK